LPQSVVSCAPQPQQYVARQAAVRDKVDREARALSSSKRAASSSTNDAAYEELYAKMTYEELSGQIMARCETPPPTVQEAIEWLRKDDAYRSELNTPETEVVASAAQRPSRADVSAAKKMPIPSGSEGYVYRLPPLPPKKRKITVTTLGLRPNAKRFTAKGWPMVSAAVLRELAGNPPERYGEAYAQFTDKEEGARACVALDALCRMGSIDTMLSTFIGPLRTLADDDSRVHCSLNLNTETGRLSSRRPNLQNQPALEKDSYHIRKAFCAPEGKSLIVADYGQLELRVLAGITKCESMLTAFREGGCFHSRTAVGMFEHVRDAVESGDVLLEKGGVGDDRPLVKDKFASERRKAKTLNFSIAYGKTAHGLANDWNVKPEAAVELLEAWYADRPEVKRWQQETIAFAKKYGYTTTLMGRRRLLPSIRGKGRAEVGRGERAAINTPIQGSAADIVMMAMIKIHESEVLDELKWKLVLQIHDEVILEGPTETADAALAEVRRCMEDPYDDVGLLPFDVDLIVDAKMAQTWYDAK